MFELFILSHVELSFPLHSLAHATRSRWRKEKPVLITPQGNGAGHFTSESPGFLEKGEESEKSEVFTSVPYLFPALQTRGVCGVCLHYDCDEFISKPGE